MKPGALARRLIQQALNQNICGGLSETRTRDQRIKSPLLYRLSYQPDRSPKLWLISPALSKNDGALSAAPTKNGRSRGRPCFGVTNLAYQAATTAPLNLVSMNCFTAGL